ncbi:U-box domain-containing protein 33 [Quillaja saponaria]|uniref:U-box domain-containing protein 33 n=1 Tax=Quillaja saponaria TaxID=32244 RepID=A0AAD7M371_QUISA|nr:U-box domain-containing protein 33 [Quillaja saponaria]
MILMKGPAAAHGILLGSRKTKFLIIILAAAVTTARLWQEEHINAEELFEINLRLPLNTIREDCEREECESSLFSYDFHGEEDCVYVAVGIGNSESSMEALLWTLLHAVSPSTTVYLIHVFPEVRLIPSPMGRLPRNHVNPEFVENYLAQEKGKRRLLLQKFINSCSASKVKVEILLIEGDDVAKAIIKLITNLNIRKLAVGTTKSNLRYAALMQPSFL